MSTRRVLRLGSLFSMLLCTSLSLLAAPVTYKMDFTVLSGSGPAPTATFTCDAAIASFTSGFTSFLIPWDGNTFPDMAASANGPVFGSVLIGTACGGPTGGAAGLFQGLLHPENCGIYGYTSWVIGNGFGGPGHYGLEFRIYEAREAPPQFRSVCMDNYPKRLRSLLTPG